MKLTEAERERAATAHHEAAHAIAAVLHSARVDSVEVYAAPRGDDHGRVTFAHGPDDRRATTYAGPWAEARYLHGPRPAVAAIRAALSGTCDGEELAELGGGLTREVEPTLEVVWPAVRSLAAALFRDGRAGHDAVLAALGAASDDDMPMIRSLVKTKAWSGPAA